MTPSDIGSKAITACMLALIFVKFQIIAMLINRISDTLSTWLASSTLLNLILNHILLIIKQFTELLMLLGLNVYILFCKFVNYKRDNVNLKMT